MSYLFDTEASVGAMPWEQFVVLWTSWICRVGQVAAPHLEYVLRFLPIGCMISALCAQKSPPQYF
ncbi:hypothetical protein, partial [Halocynthiibacter styelae]|uniref:hypothetical protein n=1 Tax=Halocynthiibacter styelae TaxID=2761955 RepID=UPI001E387AB2